MSGDLRVRILESADYLRKAGVTDPEIGIVLGSGLNDYADRIEGAIEIPYSEIPNFHAGSVQGHRGSLVYGEHLGRKVLILAGRFHYYESGDMQVTAFPARVLVELGIRRLIITNAAGCINTDFHAGQLMVISDHINLSGANPLIGENLDEYGPRFPDMTYTYNRELREKLIAKAREIGIDPAEGIYAMMSGPAFETPAEIRFAGIIGADAVGMSSVPEALIANHAGREIIGISLLTNMAAGILDQPLTAEEVNEAAAGAKSDFCRLLDLAISL